MGTDRTGLRRQPVRTCVGCRRADSWSALLRVVAETGVTGTPRLVPDPQHRLPGRGAWLHPRVACLDLAVRRRAFPRALRVSLPLDPAAVAAYLEHHTHEPSDARTESGFDADEHPMSTQR
ncbi:MAG: YlxR family protein [Micrococcales bacterium]|nr:YlxR family protein [Micrococcales bacterium]